MPKVISAIHKHFRSELFDPNKDFDDPRDANRAKVWECNSENELLDHIKMHPLMEGSSPDFMVQMLMDKKHARWYVIGIGLHDRVSIGDFDPKTGQILPGVREKEPVLLFASTTESWARTYVKDRENKMMLKAGLNPYGMDPQFYALVLEALAHKKETAKKNRITIPRSSS